MGDKEEYFPRGGKKPSVTYFKPSANFLGAAEKGERKKQKLKKKSDGDDGYLSGEIVAEQDLSTKNCAISLNYNILKEGQILLGRVWQVWDTKVNISLPCRLLGTVMACHISEPYNKVLESFINDQREEIFELKKMFRPGQYVAVRILEIKHRKPTLSMMPQHVNGGRSKSELNKGTILQAAVVSVEDHGYVMDIGIPNTRAFLPKATANPEVQLDPGSVTWCCIKSLESDNSVVTLNNQLASLRTAVQKQPTTSLLPGTALEFTVDKSLENGIEGHIFKDTTAYVQRHQVATVKGNKPKLGQKIRARVLYVLPTKLTPFLTMRNIFESSYPNLEAEQKFKDGDIIEDAQVIKIIRRAVIFKLGEGSVGTLSIRRIQVDEDLTDEDVIAKSYPIGSKHKVRVLFYNMSDYNYSLSDETKLLEERYFSFADISVGDLVTATVTNVQGHRLQLAVGRLSGQVPQTHMSDSGLFLNIKKATTSTLSKKFKVGQEVKARVLCLDREKGMLVLTMKPTLLAPDFEVLHSYEDAQVGKVYKGVIVQVRDYVLVSFFNSVVAWVPRNRVAYPPLKDDVPLEQLFHPGQIVKCTIIRVDPNNRKMAGSFITRAFDPNISKKAKAAKRRQESENSSVPQKKIKGADSDNSKKKENKNIKAKKNPPVATVDIKMEEISEESDTDAVDIKREMNGKGLKEANEDVANASETDDELPDKTVKKTENKVKSKKNFLEAVTSKRNRKKIPGEIGFQEKNIENKALEMSDTIDETENKLSEESDAIETDIQEDSDQIMTPQEQGLICLSDCTTLKACKKRVVSLIKAIKVKKMRIKRIERKIADIEDVGLNPKNKRFHTAMHMEKLVLAQRMEKLTEVLILAKEKLKEFDEDTTKEYKKKKDKQEQIVKEKETDNKSEVVDKSKSIKLETLESVLDVPSVKDFWSVPAETQQVVEESESSSSEEEEDEKPKKKRKKLTAAEKVAKAREEEERVRKLEKNAAEAALAPQSGDHFERALLATPNSSQLWIAYMAFHLQATEIERARAVGQRALKTISFREEQEKLNVWLALLNLEHRFGNKESQQKTLEDALQMNDKYQIHSKLLDIYVETGKTQELISLVELMMRKYKKQREMYEICGSACYKVSLPEKARQVMQKGLSALDKKEHVPLLVRFARLERESGASERAEALLEHILAAYPQRVDVVAVYADLLLKSRDVERLRQVMERMTSQKLPARKMKVLYKKWIEVEEKIGDQDQIEKIRKLAMDYVEKAKF